MKNGNVFIATAMTHFTSNNLLHHTVDIDPHNILVWLLPFGGREAVYAPVAKASLDALTLCNCYSSIFVTSLPPVAPFSLILNQQGFQ
jgi:hypothetical protein